MTRVLPFCAGLVALVVSASVASADRVSIGFEGPDEGPAPKTMTEDGYVIVTREMMISTSRKSGDGTDGPNEVESVMGGRGAIAIMRPDGAPFVFVSLDWQAEDGAPSISAEGYDGDIKVGADRFSLTRDAAGKGFVTFGAEGLRGKLITRLFLFPQRNSLGLGALDRVILDDPAALPGTS